MFALSLLHTCVANKIDVMRMIELKLRPRPPLIARSRIDQDFAVLLMRTSYAQAEGMARARTRAASARAPAPHDALRPKFPPPNPRVEMRVGTRAGAP